MIFLHFNKKQFPHNGIRQAALFTYWVREEDRFIFISFCLNHFSLSKNNSKIIHFCKGHFKRRTVYEWSFGSYLRKFKCSYAECSKSFKEAFSVDKIFQEQYWCLSWTQYEVFLRSSTDLIFHSKHFVSLTFNSFHASLTKSHADTVLWNLVKYIKKM